MKEGEVAARRRGLDRIRLLVGSRWKAKLLLFMDGRGWEGLWAKQPVYRFSYTPTIMWHKMIIPE